MRWKNKCRTIANKALGLGYRLPDDGMSPDKDYVEYKWRQYWRRQRIK